VQISDDGPIAEELPIGSVTAGTLTANYPVFLKK